MYTSVRIQYLLASMQFRYANVNAVITSRCCSERASVVCSYMNTQMSIGVVRTYNVRMHMHVRSVRTNAC